MFQEKRGKERRGEERRREKKKGEERRRKERRGGERRQRGDQESLEIDTCTSEVRGKKLMAGEEQYLG